MRLAHEAGLLVVKCGEEEEAAADDLEVLALIREIQGIAADHLVAQNYDTSELVGRYGLEAAWENYLRGKKGIEHFAVDAVGKRLDDTTAQSLIQGDRTTPAVEAFIGIVRGRTENSSRA